MTSSDFSAKKAKSPSAAQRSVLAKSRRTKRSSTTLSPKTKRRPSVAGGDRPHRGKGGPPRGKRFEKRRDPVDPEGARQRAGELLAFLAKKLVAKADAVTV